MTRTRYKGFQIVTQPYQLAQSGRWTVDLEIRSGGRKQGFGLDERYLTEQEADARCFGLGKRIIDGKVAGWSVDVRMRGPQVWPALSRVFSGEFGIFGLALLGIGVTFWFYQGAWVDTEPIFAWMGASFVAAGGLCLVLGARARP